MFRPLPLRARGTSVSMMGGRAIAQQPKRKIILRKLSMTPRAIKERKSKARAKKHSKCLDCEQPTTFVKEGWEYYAVHDAIWFEANPKTEGMLCIGCLERRLGRVLVPADFKDVPINQRSRSNSKRLNARLAAT
jgi:hypothetical protein